MQLDKITSEHVANYSTQRESEGLSIGTINRELRVLRRILRLAVEWMVLEKSPKIAMAGNEPFRVRVVSDVELARYLLCARPLLADVATVLNDTGVRPDELHRLRWEDITFVNGRYGALSVRYGKTDAARRTLPMTPRVRTILEARWLSAAKPTGGWIFPAPSKTGHISHSSLKKAHAKAVKLSSVEPFLLCSLRHTFATRLATSPGMDAWTLCKIMGWSSLAVAMRYIHPDENKVLEAFGQKTGIAADS
jgi:integrase